MSSLVSSASRPILGGPMIGPSLLACDLSNMARDSLMVLEAGADSLHLDVMDGHFVPNLSFGAPVIACLRNTLDKEIAARNAANTSAAPLARPIFDVHLMVSNPDFYVEEMAKAGADVFTFHLEAVMPTEDDKQAVFDLIAKVKAAGMQVGIALKPNTPGAAVLPFAELLDLVLVMTVEPGFGGQSFMQDMMPKVQFVREELEKLGTAASTKLARNIQVDGGLSPATVEAAAAAGANLIVAGSAVFKAADTKGCIDGMRNVVQSKNKWL